MGIYVKFLAFCDARSPDMVMSRDPRRNIPKFYFVQILHLILVSHKNSSTKILYFRSYQPKTSQG